MAVCADRMFTNGVSCSIYVWYILLPWWMDMYVLVRKSTF